MLNPIENSRVQFYTWIGFGITDIIIYQNLMDYHTFIVMHFCKENIMFVSVTCKKCHRSDAELASCKREKQKFHNNFMNINIF